MTDVGIYSRLERLCYDVNTSPDGIFFAIIEHFRLSQIQLSEIVSMRSRFNSKNSWKKFFRNGMFYARHSEKPNKNYSMQLDFTLIGSLIIYELIKGRCELKNRLLYCKN